jgi:hypothetical protein
VHYLFAINDGLCQVCDSRKDSSFDERYGQMFLLAHKYCIIPGCTKQLELVCTALSQATRSAEHLCTDISGPYRKLIIGNDFWILNADDNSGKAWSYSVKKKSQMGTIVDNLLIILKAASYNVQYLRCENAGGNVKGLTYICEKHNIKIEFTAP